MLFSRIQTDVLSITAQEILTLQRGVQVRKSEKKLRPTGSYFPLCYHIFQAGMASIVFDETEIVLNPTCALFVTMEAPRAIQRKIPDNFKVVNYRIGMEMIKSHYGGTDDDIQ